MDPTTIGEIVDWIQERCDQWNSKFFSSAHSPGKIFLTFVAHPEQIAEYPEINVPRTGTCDYSLYYGSCSCEVIPGTNRCLLHNHVIFSPRVQSYVKKQHEKFDGVFAQYEAEWDAKHTLRAYPLVKSIDAANIILYREVSKGLLFVHDTSTSDDMCIGYSTDADPCLQLPLTNEMKAYCRDIGLPMKLNRKRSRDGHGTFRQLHDNLYRESELGLVIETEAGFATTFCCGYSPAESPNKILPLTRELQQYCSEHGFCYRDRREQVIYPKVTNPDVPTLSNNFPPEVWYDLEELLREEQCSHIV